MDLNLTDDQRAILDAVEHILRNYAHKPSESRSFVLNDETLDRELEQGGFYDTAFDADLGLPTAALVVERLARAPYALEAAGSALLRPLLGEAARPVCVADPSRPHAPVRFLRPGATVLTIADGALASFTATDADVGAIAESLYAYPVAKLNAAPDKERLSQHEVSAAAFTARWRLALASELAGLIRGAIDNVVQYVSERKQFGRHLGAFQAVRHRLAEAHSKAEGLRWLALKAAATGAGGDAALACHFGQAAGAQTVYDLHQFLGAMGMTLEHPLHLWTYRIKALAGDLGGSLSHAKDAAELLWPA